MEEKTNTTPLSTKIQNKTEGTATYIEGRKPLCEADSKVKLMLILFSFFMYVVLFILLHYKIDYGMGIASIIPVVVVAWLYGSVPGICAAVLTFFTNIFLREYLGLEWIEKIVMQGVGILGAVANMFIGAAVGRMSDLSRQIRIKLYEQAQAEEKLLEYRNHLEDLVKERTEKLRQEVTEHKQAEGKLRETKDHLDNIIDSSLDSVVITDNKGNILRVNQSFLKLIGFMEEEVIGRHTTELSPSEEGTYESTVGEMVEINEIFFKEAKKMHSRLLEEGKIKNWKRYLARKDQKIVPVEVNTVFLYNSEGDFSGSVGILRDITEKEKAEKEISESRDFLENIFRTSADAIIITGNNGVITLANEAIEKILGYSRGELVGKSAEELTPKEVKHQEEGKKFITELLKGGVVTNFNRTWLKKDGSLVDVEISAALLKDKGGTITGAVASIRDITERKRAEEELRNTKDHLESIIENSLDCITVSDNTAKISKVNNSFLKLLGFKEEEVIGKYTYDFTPSEKGAYESTTGEQIEITEEFFNNVKTMLERLYDEGKIENRESYFVRKDGRLLPVEENISLLYNEEGGVIGGLGIIRDITNRKKIEKEIIETRNFLEDVFNTTADGIMVTDSQGSIVRVNRATEQMLGFREDELIGKYTSELGTQSEERKKESAVMLEQLFEKGFVNNFEAAWYRKDRSLCPVEMSITFIKDKEGNISGSVGAIRDITERKKAEEALQGERDFSNMVIETADVLITGVDLEGKLFLFNRKAEEVTGYSREEVMGNDFVKVLIPEEGRTAFAKLIDEIKRRGKIINSFDATLITKNGEERIITSRGTPLKNIEGEIVGILGIGLDVTETRKIEGQLLQSEKLRSLGELSGGVAHDFNNVLAAILGRVQLLKIHLNPPLGKQEKRKSVLELRKGLEIIEKASLDGAETVRRIQEFSRRRADDKDFTQVDINELLDNALEFTRIRWKNETESKGIKIRIKKELSPLTPILGSSSELREVFTNLINNAIDAMPQGGEIRINSFMDDNNVVVKIEDTGSGISKTIKDRIFDPFFTSKGVQSTGLGLSVSYGIINRHRGTTTVDSVEGEGTTFSIKFPVAKKTGKENVKKEQVIPIKRKQQKASILVIEDEEDVRELLRDILTDAGHDVEIANGGSEGIEIFKKKKFDLVFTDLGMPVMSGWEVAEKVKSINRKVPVALITGWNVALDSSEMNDSGINLVIQKPFKMEQVLSLVQEGMLLRDQLKAV